MAKTTRIGSLETKTVPTIHGKARVVLLPGHEIPIEHFFPSNQTHLEQKSTRTRLVQSNLHPNHRFYAKETLPTHYGQDMLTHVSEARLARYVNSLGITGVKVEEPLAVVFRKPGKNEVIYREINARLTKMRRLNTAQSSAYAGFVAKLKEKGITPGDHSTGVDESGTIRIVDIEAWEVEPKKAKELRLKRVFGRV